MTDQQTPPEQPRPVPPAPKPSAVPTPAALRRVVRPAVPAAPAVALGPSPSVAFGRVDDDGHVFVREGDEEREVGTFVGSDKEEALQLFARKYDDLLASADLLHQRLLSTDISSKEAAESLGKIIEQTAEPKVVGDLAALAAKVEDIRAVLAARRESEAAERTAARQAARVERERIVAEAERIAGQPENKIQWKSSGARMRELLDEWKVHQRSGPKLDKASENDLWQRFSHARNGFDKMRRTHFAQLDETQGEAKSAKESLVREAEQLSTNKDWGPTATAFKRLMDRWRTAGRASRADDDALWLRFKAAQDAFFAAKDVVAAKEDEEFRANLAVKDALLTEAQSILPVTNLESTKARLRAIQDQWDKVGKVPRGDMERTEKGLRRIETVVRDAEEKRWAQSNPEAAARAQSLVTQLESAVADLEADVSKAESSGNTRKAEEARAALEARQQWLAQARAGLDEFGG